VGLAALERDGVRAFVVCAGLLLASAVARSSSATNTEDRATVIVVVGAPGEEAYGTNFAQWADRWRQASKAGNAKFISIGPGETNDAPTDLERLKKALAAEAAESSSDLWLVLIGHGTFDGKDAKFNLRGPDLSATDLADWLKPFHRRIAVIDCASSGSPFLSKLSATNRVIVTATRSGYEQNYARFGEYVPASINDPRADLDKDGQTSLLEAFLTASRRVAEFYETEGRLATEHALLDDNGDGLGTPSDWFRGVRAVKKAKEGASVDGLRAHQLHLVRSEQEQRLSPAVRARRDAIELEVAQMRETKGQLDEDEYYRQLEKLLVELAKLYQQVAAKP
jgi:hypothetical protein